MKSFFSVENIKNAEVEEPNKKASIVDFLKSRVTFAMDSKDKSLIYESRGMVRMAWNLEAISTEEYSKLMNMLKEYGVVNGAE